MTHEPEIIEKYDNYLDIGKSIIDKALEFRSYCLKLDLIERERIYVIGKILGMNVEIKFKYERQDG